MFIMLSTADKDGLWSSKEIHHRGKNFVDQLVTDTLADPDVATFELKVWSTRTKAGLVKVDGKLVPTEGPDYSAYKDLDGTFTSLRRIDQP